MTVFTDRCHAPGLQAPDAAARRIHQAIPQAKEAGSESELRFSVSSSSSEAVVWLPGAAEPDCGCTPTHVEGSDDEPSKVRDDELLVAHGEPRGRNFTPTVVVDSDEEFATQVLSYGFV